MTTHLYHCLMLLLLISGCNNGEDAELAMPQAPLAPVVPEEPPAPPEQEFPLQEHVLRNLQALGHMNPMPTYLVAVRSPTEIWEIIDAEPPSIDVDWNKHEPELMDLHPSRMKAMGLDPGRPAGIAVYAEPRRPIHSGAVWIIFAAISDEAAFRKAFQLGALRPSGTFVDENYNRTKRTYRALENGEVLIAQRIEARPAEKKSLAEDLGFQRLSEALDYGEMATGYFTSKRAQGIYGVGLDQNGLGIKVFADDPVTASMLRLKFAEHAAGAFPRMTYLQRAVNLRTELHSTGRAMRAEIDGIEHLPGKRRAQAASTMIQELPQLGSLDGEAEGLHVAGRLWDVNRDDIKRAYREWENLGPTLDEQDRIADLESRINDMELMGKADVLEISETMKAASKGKKPAIPGMGLMTGMGGMMAMGESMMGVGGDSKKGKDGKKGKDAGPMGMLGGLGGLLGKGGGDEEREINISSKDKRLRSHMRKRLRQLTFCWVKAPNEKEFTVTASLEIAPETGKLTIHSLRGSPKPMESCIREAIGKKGTPPKPDPNPDAGPTQPIIGKVNMKFKA